MSEARFLADLLRAADGQVPIVHGEATLVWPSGALEACLHQGWLIEAAPADSCACRECHLDPACEVHWLPQPDSGEPMVLVSCAECGTYSASLQTVRRWRLDWTGFLDAIFESRGLTGRREETIPQRLWHLGPMRFDGSV